MPTVLLPDSYSVNSFVAKKLETRLSALREALVLNWGELAEHLEISRSMLDFLRRGERHASPSLERRILGLEVQAGLATKAQLPLAREDRGLYLSREPPQNVRDEISAIRREMARLLARLEDLETQVEEGDTP
jgi:transcriptional regulator with XRE-family HTH domain